MYFIQRDEWKSVLRHNRRHIKAFKTSDAMYRFLNHGDNATRWAITTNKTFNRSGTYAFAGGKWHNVKDLDATALAHI